MARRPIDPPTPPSGEHDRHEHRYYRWGTPIAALAFLVSCAAAGFAFWQGYLISESNEITRKNNTISQRAFVYPTLAQTHISTDAANVPIAVNFLYLLTNSGNTATRDMKIFIKCAPSAEEIQEPWSILYQGPDKPDSYPAFVGPHGSEQTGCSFSINQIKDMIAGKLHGYVMIDVSYYDRIAIGVLRKTQHARKLVQISLQIPPTITPITPALFATLLVPRGRHNCADEECPD